MMRSNILNATVHSCFILSLILGLSCNSPADEAKMTTQTTMNQMGSIDDSELEALAGKEWRYYQDSDFYLEAAHTNVIRQIIFLQEGTPGVVPGFNLDDRISEDGDEYTCGHADLEDPQGREGIDNQFATLLRILSAIVEDTPQIAIQGAINEGRVLMMVELLGVDSLPVSKSDVSRRQPYCY